MQYEVAFDVLTQSFDPWMDARLPLVVSIACSIFAVVKRWKTSVVLPDWRISGLAAAVLGGMAYSDYRTSMVLRDALVQDVSLGKASVVEGYVSDFVREGNGGHPPESFSVGDAKFSISSYVRTAAYTKTVERGGVLREGAWVRLSHIDGLITRIDSLAR
jgi:hypothetical protein